MFKGYAVVDGIRMPITMIELTGGQLVFWTSLRGPVKARAAETAVTIFGEDDRGVCQASPWLQWRQVGTLETLVVKIEMRMDSCLPATD